MTATDALSRCDTPFDLGPAGAGDYSGPLSGVVETTVLQDRKTVRHAGDVVGHSPSPALGPALLLGYNGNVAMLRWHEVHIAEESVKQRFQDATRFRCHAQHLVVSIQVFAQEHHQLNMF